MIAIRAQRPTDGCQYSARIGDSPRPRTHPSSSILSPFSSSSSGSAQSSLSTAKGDNPGSKFFHTTHYSPAISTDLITNQSQLQYSRLPIVKSLARARSQSQSVYTHSRSLSLTRKPSSGFKSQEALTKTSEPRKSSSYSRPNPGVSLPRSAPRPTTPQLFSNLTPQAAQPSSSTVATNSITTTSSAYPQCPTTALPPQPQLPLASSFVTSLGLAPISTNSEPLKTTYSSAFPISLRTTLPNDLRQHQFPTRPRISSDSYFSTGLSKHHPQPSLNQVQQNFPPSRFLPSLAGPSRPSEFSQQEVGKSLIIQPRQITLPNFSGLNSLQHQQHQKLQNNSKHHRRSHSSPTAPPTNGPSQMRFHPIPRSSPRQSLSLPTSISARITPAQNFKDGEQPTRPAPKLYHVVVFKPEKGFCGKFAKPKPKFESKAVLRPTSVIGKRSASTLENQDIDEMMLQVTGNLARRRRKRGQDRSDSQRTSLEALAQKYKAVEGVKSESTEALKAMLLFNLERAAWKSEKDDVFSFGCGPAVFSLSFPSDRNNFMSPRVTSLSNANLRSQKSRRWNSTRVPIVSEFSPSPSKLRKVAEDFHRSNWLSCVSPTSHKLDPHQETVKNVDNLFPILSRPFRNRPGNHALQLGQRNRSTSLSRISRPVKSSPAKDVDSPMPYLKNAIDRILFIKSSNVSKSDDQKLDGGNAQARKKMHRRSRSVPELGTYTFAGLGRKPSMKSTITASSPRSDETQTFFELGTQPGARYEPCESYLKDIVRSNSHSRYVEAIEFDNLQEGRNSVVAEIRSLKEKHYSSQFGPRGRNVCSNLSGNRPVSQEERPLMRDSPHSFGLEDSICDPKIKQLIAAINSDWSSINQERREAIEDEIGGMVSVQEARRSDSIGSSQCKKFMTITHPKTVETIDDSLPGQINSVSNDGLKRISFNSPSSGKGLLYSLPPYIETAPSNVSSLAPPPRKRNMTTCSGVYSSDYSIGSGAGQNNSGSIPSSRKQSPAARISGVSISKKLAPQIKTKLASYPLTPRSTSNTDYGQVQLDSGTTLPQSSLSVQKNLYQLRRVSASPSFEDRWCSRLSDSILENSKRCSDCVQELSNEDISIGNINTGNTLRGSFGRISTSQEKVDYDSPVDWALHEVNKAEAGEPSTPKVSYVPQPSSSRISKPENEKSEVEDQSNSNDREKLMKALENFGSGSRADIKKPQRQLSNISARSGSSSNSTIDLDKYIDQADLFYQAPRSPRRDLIEDYDQILDYQYRQKPKPSNPPRISDASSGRSKIVDEILNDYADRRRNKGSTTVRGSKELHSQLGFNEFREKEQSGEEGMAFRGKHLSKDIVDKFEKTHDH
ncbi:hypothetical protein BY996DRAFT_6419988 [Phakopsora pachyrhizi]|nr:hypothetical protein BY996DRAFT_6419988 [Phakopsora pachyrhizi]